MNITYTARRSLITGHVAGNEYTLTIDTTDRAYTRRVEKVQQKSLSGRLETLYFNGEGVWRVTFVPVNGQAARALREFLDSTESGELFAMSLNGEDQPDVAVKRTDSGYDFTTFLEVGDLDDDWRQSGIEVMEQ